MTSTISQIRRRVAQRASEELLGHLIDRAVQWHTRKGVRPDCDCTYCKTKRWATSYVGFTPNTVLLGARIGPHWTQDCESIVWLARNRRRREARQKLAAVKQDIV